MLFYIKAENRSVKKGYDYTIEVYRQKKDDTFQMIGRDNQIHRASYIGDEAISKEIIEKSGISLREKKDIKFIFFP